MFDMKMEESLRKVDAFRMLAGPALGILLFVISYSLGSNLSISKTCLVAGWMIYWWIDCYMPLGLTGLLPIVLFPLLGVVSSNEVSEQYFNDGMILCIGSLLISRAIEKCHLHLIVARAITDRIDPTSNNHSIILLIFISISGFASMWISNTATSVLMLPIANAVLDSMRTAHLSADHSHSDETNIDALGTAIDLGIGFAVSIGGMATLIGTGSNIVLVGILKTLFGPENDEISFLGWMILVFPISVIGLLLLWVILCVSFLWPIPTTCCNSRSHQDDSKTKAPVRSMPISTVTIDGEAYGNDVNIVDGDDNTNSKHKATTEETKDAFDSDPAHNIVQNSQQEEKKQGQVTYEAKVVAWTFVVLVLLWLTRAPPGNWGWAEVMGIDQQTSDGTVVMGAVLFLMLCPLYPLPLSTLVAVIKCKQRRSEHVHNNHETKDGYIRSPTMIQDEEIANPLSNSSVHYQPHDHDHEDGGDIELSTLQFEETKDVSKEGLKQRNHQPRKSSAKSVIDHSPHDSASKTKPQLQAILPFTAFGELNWNIILLLGGGFALSRGFEASGFSKWISRALVRDGPKTLNAFTFVATVFACLLTNIMSNVAAANVLLPSIACVGPHFGYAPITVLLPVTLSLSVAFLFPVGTPANAIILANKRVSSSQLFKVGALSCLMMLAVILVFALFIMPRIVDLGKVSENVQGVCS